MNSFKNNQSVEDLLAALSEDLGVTVSVLEAGEDDDKFPYTKVPLELFNLQNSEIDWAYRTVPQEKACFSLKRNVSGFLGIQCKIKSLALFV